MKRLTFIALFLGILVCVYAQQGSAAAATAASAVPGASVAAEAEEGAFALRSERIALAQASADYPVTPGDVYALSFVTSAGPVALKLIVESDYSISMGNLGSLNAAGMTFIAVKRVIEKKVLDAYQLSAPMLAISSVGLLKVFVTGEVKSSNIVSLWGYSRLSELWDSVKTKYASSRDVLVRSADGKERVYDLFAYWRTGNRAQDALLKANDTVILSKAERIVNLSGEVHRPGQYQLRPGENLKQLIESYGDGFTFSANHSRLRLTRFSGTADPLGMKDMIEFDPEKDFPLNDGDAVVVPAMQELLPVVFFEGAIGTGQNGADPLSAARKNYTFFPGERLSQAVQALNPQFSAVSDLKSAYVIRGDRKIPVNLADFIFDKDYSNDMDLQANDIILVPFRQFFVSVAGAVKAPGRYPYIPDRNWEYYVNLAGGVDEERSSGMSIKILDVYGKSQARERIINPEDSVSVKADSFIYGFGRVAGIISAIISTASLVISLIMAFR